MGALSGGGFEVVARDHESSTEIGHEWVCGRHVVQRTGSVAKSPRRPLVQGVAHVSSQLGIGERLELIRAQPDDGGLVEMRKHLLDCRPVSWSSSTGR